MAQSKVKGALFATDRFPLGSLSSYLTSMVVLHVLYLINSIGSFGKVPKLAHFFVWCSVPKEMDKKN